VTGAFLLVNFTSAKRPPSRSRCMKKAMADPRMRLDANPMPFDGKRLIYGGFEVLVDA